MMAYQFGWVDENGNQSEAAPAPLVHGRFCLEVAETLGGDPRTALPYAVAIELLHNFLQIHVDVEDGNTERQGRPSVWWAWGPAQAINAGDGMHAMARLALFQLSGLGVPPASVTASLRILDEATVQLCEGEYLDITFQEKPRVSVDEYLDMASRRSGALMGCAARLGAFSAGEGGDRAVIPLEQFGTQLGLAGHIISDHTLIWGRGGRDQAQQGRLASKKKNLPVVHALSSGEPAMKRRIGELYMKRILDTTDIEALAGLLDAAGSEQFTLAAVEQTRARAEDALLSAGLDEAAVGRLRAALDELAPAPSPSGE